MRYLQTRTWMSVVGLLVAAAGAVAVRLLSSNVLFLSLFCMPPSLQSGANIRHACLIVGAGGAAGAVALSVLGPSHAPGRVLAALLSVEAAVLSIGLVLVAADSARYVKHYWDNGCATGREIHSVTWLFAAWGAPLVLLLVRAYGAWKGIERHDADELRERRRSNFSVPQA